MGVELAPVKAMLDQPHPGLPTLRDQNSYRLGEMGGHNEEKLLACSKKQCLRWRT